MISVIVALESAQQVYTSPAVPPPPPRLDDVDRRIIKAVRDVRQAKVWSIMIISCREKAGRKPSPAGASFPGNGGFLSLVLARGNSCVQLPYGKTTMRQRFEILASPILYPLFSQRLWREVIMEHADECFPKLSRTASLVFLLDPGAKLVWPHPRFEPASDIGTVLAHWILRLRNPGLAVRELPGLGCQTSTEIELEFEREIRWRSMMLETYGDK